MNTVLIDKKIITFSDNQLIGKGGEADVFKIDNQNVLKLFKQPNHPDYEHNLQEQKGAILRLDEHQRKLINFPTGLPDEVISPKKLAKSKTGKILGYTMPFLDKTEVLLKYAEKSFRVGGITDETVVMIFQKLLSLLYALHEKDIVIGDFNDLNVMVKGHTPYIIDADSMQYGEWKSRVFTGKFVDPLLCDRASKTPRLVRSHNRLSDLYAFNIMLMQSLLFVGPYGGVYKPKDKTKRIPHDARPLHGISLWHPDVRYPKPARRLDILPDSLQQELKNEFVEGKRGFIKKNSLDNLQFDKKGNLLSLVKPSSNKVFLKEVVTGAVKAKKVFSTSGHILFTTVQNEKLMWIYHSNGSYKRETGRVILPGKLTPNLRFRIGGEETIFGKGRKVVVFAKDGTNQEVSIDAIGNLPLIDANSKGLVYVSEGSLNRSSDLGLDYTGEFIGEVLPNQTLFWVSEELGFAFYRAAKVTRYCIFNPKKRGINDSVNLPKINGKITDVSCKFGSNVIWFSLSVREKDKSMNYCYLIGLDGRLIASESSPQGDGSWLGEIQGGYALGSILLVPTDEGIYQIQAQEEKLLVTKEFPDTARFVDTSSQLFPSGDGVFVKSSKEIWKLTI